MFKFLAFGCLFFGLHLCFFFNPQTLKLCNVGQLNQKETPSNGGCFFYCNMKTLTHFLGYLLRCNYVFFL